MTIDLRRYVRHPQPSKPPPAPTPTPTPAPAPTSFTAGVSPGAGVLNLTSAAASTLFGAMKTAGAGGVRIDAPMPSIEPTKGAFDWGVTDTAVNAAIAADLEVLLIADYAPGWTSPATIAADYSAFLSALVKRYPDVKLYELWNEPNLGGNWFGSSSGTEFAELVIAAYPAVKAVNPTATVITGGLSPATDGGGDIDPATFLTEMYAAGVHGFMDAVGIHPYSFPYPPMTAGSWNTFYELPTYRSIMIANGDGAKQIWPTEFGFPTTFPSDPSNAVSTADQALYLTQAFAQFAAWAPWIGPAFWYDWSDSEDSTGDFGLVTSTGEAKPALAAFTALDGEGG